MQSLNKAQIIGNLTRDPEIRYTPNGQAVSSFSVATNRRWNDKEGNPQEDAQFHEIVAWGKLAEIICQIFKKGQKIYVEGRLQTRSWDAPDGSKRQRTEIILENFVPLTPKGNTDSDSEFFKSNKDESPKFTEKSEKKEISKNIKTDKKTEKEDEDVINLDDIPF